MKIIEKCHNGKRMRLEKGWEIKSKLEIDCYSNQKIEEILLFGSCEEKV